jgi:hypothetical protein
MELPSILQGDSLKHLLQGAAVGAVATMIVGFNWGGWMLGSSVDKVAKERADTAVVAALAPVCVDQFRQAANAGDHFDELSKIGSSWDRGTFVEKGRLGHHARQRKGRLSSCASLRRAARSAESSRLALTTNCRRFVRCTPTDS